MSIRKFIIVDDDPFSNIISSMAMKSSLGEVETKTFTEPERALVFIQKKFIETPEPIVLFLDINMPTMSGWEFMEVYKNFDEEIKQYINIYILSSSVDERDKDKSRCNKYIKGFISKPLENEAIISIAKSSAS